MFFQSNEAFEDLHGCLRAQEEIILRWMRDLLIDYSSCVDILRSLPIVDEESSVVTFLHHDKCQFR